MSAISFFAVIVHGIARLRRDAYDLLAERGCISVHCHYCNTDYTFDENDLRMLFGESE